MRDLDISGMAVKLHHMKHKSLVGESITVSVVVQHIRALDIWSSLCTRRQPRSLLRSSLLCLDRFTFILTLLQATMVYRKSLASQSGLEVVPAGLEVPQSTFPEVG